MSIRYVATVLDKLPDLSASDTLVLIALADYASDDTRQCWPSVSTIARRARLTRRAVQKRLRSLEARGLIEVSQGGHQYGRNSASQYRLRFDHDGHIAPEEQLSTRANAVRRGANGATRKGERGDAQGRTTFAPSVIDPLLIQRGAKSAANKESRVRAAAALSDDELDQRAQSGKLTAEEEYEREHRRRARPRREGLQRVSS